MSIQTGLEQIIRECSNSKKTTFVELKEEIITNFNNCDLSNCDLSQCSILKEENKGRKLIITRPKFRDYFRKELYYRLRFNKIVKETGYEYDKILAIDECNFNTIEEIIEICTKIFVEKQKQLLIISL